MLDSFFASCNQLQDDAFLNAGNNRFNIALFEAVFHATCRQAFEDKVFVNGHIEPQQVRALEIDPEFVAAAVEGSTHTVNVAKRLARAKALVSAL